MSSLHISCPSCGSPNDLGMERCHLCEHPLCGKPPSKRIPQPSRSRLSRRTILWGAATAVALATGGYLTYQRLTNPHILTYAESGGVLDAAWSPDGTRVASVSEDDRGAVQIWDATSGKRMPAFRRVAPTNTMAWSPDGKSLAVGTGIWDVETGNKVTEYTVEGRFSLVWSPEGKRVAVASYTGGHYWVPTYGNLFVFDASSGEQMAKYDQGRFDIFVAGMGRMAWSPNGKNLLVLNGRIDLWKMEFTRK